MGAMSSVVAELRRTRRVRRLGELEWFEVAYRAYLAALAGGVVVLWLSGLVSDEPATAAEVADVSRYGPAVIGMIVALALALGLRSGSDGGPVALEAADVRHLLLAPVSRRRSCLTPVVQRLRAMAFGGALVGADRRTAGGTPPPRIRTGVGGLRRVGRSGDRLRLRRRRRHRPRHPPPPVDHDRARRRPAGRPGRGGGRLVARTR